MNTKNLKNEIKNVDEEIAALEGSLMGNYGLQGTTFDHRTV